MKNGRIKILHVLYTLNPGGMENGVVNIARALPPERFEIHVCCLEKSGPFAQRLPQPENVHVLNKRPGFSVRTIWDLHRVIHRVKPHLIHTHNLGPLIYGGLLKNLGCRRPLLHGEHMSLTADECSPRRLRQRAWFYRSCAKIHTVAEGLRQQLLELGFPADKISTLINGVDCDRFRPGDRHTARREIGLPEEGLFLGIVGRFAPSKRHGVLLNSFSRLAGKYPNLHLLVIGSGGDEEKNILRMARASEFAERIHCMGFQNNLLHYYQALDLLVAPSTQEGLSNAVLEAMACGVPVLAHPACGSAEVITDGQDGFIANLDTADKLYGKLEPLLAHPENLAELGGAARIKVVGNFSIDLMINNYRELYLTLTGKPN